MIDPMLKSTDARDSPDLNVFGPGDRFVCTLMDVAERKHAQDVREALGQAEAGVAQVSRVNTMAKQRYAKRHISLDGACGRSFPSQGRPHPVAAGSHEPNHQRNRSDEKYG